MQRRERRTRRKPRKPADPGRPFEGVVEALGAQGDGIARDGDTRLFVPFALFGERVKGTARGGRLENAAVLEVSPVRVNPPCPVFGQCGGCALQHLDTDEIAVWKRDRAVTALRQRGLEDIDVALALSIGTGTRRRVTVHYVPDGGGGAALGFLGRRSHDFVPVADCLVLHEKLRRAWKGLAALVGVLGGRGEIYCLQAEKGLDLDLRPAGEVPGIKVQTALAAKAEAMGAARVSIHGEVVAEWRPPAVTMGQARVTPPPGGFLQPSAEGEAALVRLVLEGAGEGPYADLFAGCGTFTFPLAARGAVHAVEGDAAALAALAAAARHAQGLKPVTTEERDLFEWPLTAKELARFAAVIFDPPRAGAPAQARELAASPVPRIVAVSCNPATFARDARILIDGGYGLMRVTPVDQFPWSPHIECVGVFMRA